MSNKEALQHGEQMFFEGRRMGTYGKIHKTVLFFSFLLPQCVPLLIMLSVQVYGEK